MNKKAIFLIGSISSGENTSQENLVDSFETETNRLVVIDFPSFDDDDLYFLKKFLDNRSEVENVLPILALMLVVTFDETTVCQGFLSVAKQFVKLFGTTSITSLMILCIQETFESACSNQDAFETVLRQSDGYKYLIEKNGGQEIPYCLWDNVNPFAGQQDRFRQCLLKLRKIEKLSMSFIFDLIRNELEYRNDILRGENNETNKTKSPTLAVEQEAKSQQLFSYLPNFLDNMIFYISSMLRRLRLQEKSCILVTGTTNEEKLKLLLESVYKIQGKYSRLIEEYESNEYKFIVCSGLERADFNLNEFKIKCFNNKSKLVAIICLENLNPRSNELKENLKILKTIFSLLELNELLYLFFTFTGKCSSLDKLRMDALNFNEVFNALSIRNDKEKHKFVNQKIWILESNSIRDLVNLKFLRFSSFFKAFPSNASQFQELSNYRLVHFKSKICNKRIIVYNSLKEASWMPLIPCNGSCCAFDLEIFLKTKDKDLMNIIALEVDGFVLEFLLKNFDYKNFFDTLSKFFHRFNKYSSGSVLFIFSGIADDRSIIESILKKEDYLNLLKAHCVPEIPFYFCDLSLIKKETEVLNFYKCLEKLKKTKIKLDCFLML